MVENRFWISKEILMTGRANFIGSEVLGQLCELKVKVTALSNLSSEKEECVEEFNDVNIIMYEAEFVDDSVNKSVN